MLLSNTDAQAALLAANKIRKIIEKTAFNSNGDKISITLSCGVAQFDGDDTGKLAFERADKALYNAKNNGRNQCVIG
jgi:diguanylate cyclase